MSKKIEFQVGKYSAKTYVGNLSDLPEVQALRDRFRKAGEKRSNVVMIRLSDDAIKHIDLLVEATLFTSRSEAAAFLIGAGIESQKDLLEKFSAHAEEIQKLKEQLRKIAMNALKPENR